MGVLYALESIRTPALDKIMSVITLLGGELFFMVIAVAVFWCVSKREGYYLMIVGFFGTVINQFLKILCCVPRPWVKDPGFTIVESARADATGYSFPSGHTQNAVATYGGIARYTGRKWLRAVLIVLTLWGVLQQNKGSETPSSQPDSVPESSAVTEPVNLTPDFVGLNYDMQVRNDREYAGSYLFYVTLEYSDTVEEGRVIRQSPEAGEVLEKGGTVSLVVSKGPEKVEMPNIVGFTRDAAEQQLAQVGLNASFYPIYNDGSYVSGCVAYCSENAGTRVDVGSTVVVYLAAEVEATVPVTPEEAPAVSSSSSGQEEAASSSQQPSPDEVEYDTD